MSTTLAPVSGSIGDVKDSYSAIHIDDISQCDTSKEFPQLSPVISGVGETKAMEKRNGENGYYRNEELGGPIHSEREMKIIVVGAGASALCFAYKLQRSFQKFSLKLYEKNPEISGTWFENRYPG